MIFWSLRKHACNRVYQNEKLLRCNKGKKAYRIIIHRWGICARENKCSSSSSLLVSSHFILELNQSIQLDSFQSDPFARLKAKQIYPPLHRKQHDLEQHSTPTPTQSTTKPPKQQP